MVDGAAGSVASSAGSSSSSTSGTDTIKSFLSTHGQLGGKTENNLKASQYIRGKGWRQFKFIDKPSLLNLDRGICNSYMNYFDYPKYIKPVNEDVALTIAEKAFNARVKTIRETEWNKVSPFINKSLNMTRANRCQEMKKCLDREYIVVNDFIRVDVSPINRVPHHSSPRSLFSFLLLII